MLDGRRGAPGWIAAVLMLLACPAALAAESVDVCVKYETTRGWSKGYAVEAILLDGRELNRRVGSLSRFTTYASYAVIFWGEDQATILELPTRRLMRLEQEATDQRGVQWRIQEGHRLCY